VTAWQVRLVDRDGTPIGASATPVVVASARPGPYSHRLRSWGEFTFTASIFDPAVVANMAGDVVTCEVQLYRDATLVWWGVPWFCTDDLAAQTSTFRCRSLESYWDTKRLFGHAPPPDLAVNGSFEDWTAGVLDAWSTDGSFTSVTEETVDVVDGGSSVVLVATSNAPYLWEQDLTGFDIGYQPGLPAQLVGWFKVDTAPTSGDVLAELLVSGAPGTFTEQFVWQDGMAVGAWQFFSVELLVAAGVDWTAEWRLHGINGTVRYDKVRVRFNDATTAPQGADLADLFYNVVTYAQDTAAGYDNLAIDVTALAPAVLGIPVYGVGWAHSDHEEIWRNALLRLQQDYNVDFWVDLTRKAQVATKRGQVRADLDLTVTAAAPAAARGLTVESDPTQATTVAIARSESQLFAREEEIKTDTSSISLTLARFETAPVSVTPRGLEALAQGIIDREATGQQIPTIRLLTTNPPEPGDRFALSVDYGRCQLTGNYRVSTVRVDPRFPGACWVDVDVDDGRAYPA